MSWCRERGHGSEDGLCGRCRGEGSRALPPQSLVWLVLNEAAEHGEGGKRPVRGHHVPSSLWGTSSHGSVLVMGLPQPPSTPSPSCRSPVSL